MFDLENPENWQTRDSQFLSTAPETVLLEYLSSVTFTSTIIAVLVDNSQAKDTWKFAGNLARKINLPVGPSSTPSLVNFRKLWLKQKQLLFFPLLTANYQLLVKFPKWFTQASITVWEYTGQQQVDNAEQLTQINLKIDTLLQQHPP
jgi:hypothetical protein